MASVYHIFFMISRPKLIFLTFKSPTRISIVRVVQDSILTDGSQSYLVETTYLRHGQVGPMNVIYVKAPNSLSNIALFVFHPFFNTATASSR